MGGRRITSAALLVGCVGFLTAGCSDTGTSSDEQSPVSVPTIAVPQADVSATVDGAPLPGVDLTKLFCSRMQSIILSGQDPIDGRAGLGALLEPGDPPVLDHVSFGLDGVLYTSKPGKGRATVTQDGDRMTIRGTAESYEPADNPLTKTFEVSATCD